MATKTSTSKTTMKLSTKTTDIWLEPYVELIRVSTHAQAEHDTHEKQRYDLGRAATAHAGARCVARIEAPGVSGTLGLADSEEGRQLSALAGKFAVLRITKINRVFGGRSEDPIYKAEVASLCFRTGAKLLEVSSGQSYDPRDPMQQIMLLIALGFSAKERSDLVENTNKGRFRRARANKSPGGRHYIGRKWNPIEEKWVYHEEQRKIFEQIKRWMLVDHLSLNEIARRLNKARVPTLLSGGKGMPEAKLKRPRRWLWHGRTIASMFRHRHLVGESFYTNDHTPGERAELTIPPLLSEEEWQQIQTYLDTRHVSTRPADPSRAPILIGRIRCLCGARMYEKSGRYYCSTAHSNHRVMGAKQCPYVKYHGHAEVDAAAWEAITSYVARDVLAKVADPDQQLDIWKYEDEIATFERELAAVKRREANVGKTYAEGQMGDDAWRTTHKALKSTEARLSAQIHQAQQTVARLRASVGAQESLEAAIKGIRARIRSAKPEDRRALIHAVVPDAAGYGITLKPDGEIVIEAGLMSSEPEIASGGSQRARMDKLGSPACR